MTNLPVKSYHHTSMSSHVKTSYLHIVPEWYQVNLITLFYYFQRGEAEIFEGKPKSWGTSQDGTKAFNKEPDLPRISKNEVNVF